MNEIKHVGINVSQEEATKKALKYRRPRNFWQTAKGMFVGKENKGARGFLSGVAAVYFLLFPITLPIFLLTKKRHNLDWVRLTFWPFYKATVQLSTISGLKNSDVFVEGMTHGLSKGVYDPVVSGEWRLYEKRPHSDPFHIVYYKRKKELKNIVTSTPQENSAVIPFSLDEHSVVDYILDNLVQRGALGSPDDNIRGAQVLQIEGLYYPIWVAKYSLGENARIMTLGAANKRAFHRMDISDLVFSKDNLSALSGK